MIAVIDYQINNISSIVNQLTLYEIKHKIVRNPRDLKPSDKIIISGVGSFGSGMRNLTLTGMDKSIRGMGASNTPILGICLGMQLLFEASQEAPQCKGLGLIAGEVVRFRNVSTPVPHMGWNEINWIRESFLAKGILDNVDLYFAHSYHCKPFDNQVIKATTEYEIAFASIIEFRSIIGVQFHPEKSYKPGEFLLRNFAELT